MPDEIEILPVEIHLPGLLKLLGEHLYSDPRVAVRELTQNAHDSCVRRRQEDRSLGRRYKPAIHVRVHRESQQLTIEDNGSGLTRDEIQTFLATVGRGYTGELRERLGAAGRAEAMELIGLFGLGLLSAFMIAQRIEIVTASYQQPDQGWRWVSEGGQSYALRPATRDAVGTTVRLDVRDDAKFLLDEAVLSDILTVYAEFLPIPIYVGGRDRPINGRPAPWASARTGTDATGALEYTAWVEERRGARPLTVVPLADATGPDGQTIPLKGVLYVPPRSIISIQEYGDVTVYVRHMLITEHERDLLPEWGRFVSGVIDCPLLNPTASRESLRHDDVYAAVHDALAQQLLSHFERLAESAPLDWSAIVHAHNDLIKGWAVRSPELFERVADLVSFRTSRGVLMLPEYLRESPGRIFYYDDDEGVTQALALYEARRLAVVDARWFADTAFLRRYGEFYGVPVERLEPGAGYLFTPVQDMDGTWEAVLAACRAEGFPARLLSFEPEHLPMILLYPPGAERVRRARRGLDEGRYAGPIRRLVRGYLERQELDDTALTGVLHLNARNPLLRHVRDLGPQHKDFAPLVSILVANARVFAGQGLSAQDTIACFEQINTSLARLAGMSSDPAGRHTLSLAALTELGLHPDAAARLCALCQTEDELLAADIQALAERAKISPLMLATIREELKARGSEQKAEAEAEAAGSTAPEDEHSPMGQPKLVPIRGRKAPAGDEEREEGGAE